MLFPSATTISQPNEFIRLYLHEAERTYADRMIHIDDIELFQKLIRETIRKGVDVM
jgi:hypothetical protein